MLAFAAILNLTMFAGNVAAYSLLFLRARRENRRQAEIRRLNEMR